MPEEEYAASISPWEPLGDCKPCIPALWPAAPPSATGGNGGLLEEEEDDVRVVTSPGQLFPSSSSSSLSASGAQAQATKQQAPLPPSSSTNTLLPAPFSAPTTPFSSHEGTPSISGSASASGRPTRAQSLQPPLASQPEHPSTAAHGAAREQRALSHQPTTAASSSNSLVGLAGAGLGGSAAPSPFNSTRGVGSASAAASPFNSSSGHRGAAALGSSAGVEKKDGALVSPGTAGGLHGQEGTTLADFDYEVRTALCCV